MKLRLRLYYSWIPASAEMTRAELSNLHFSPRRIWRGFASLSRNQNVMKVGWQAGMGGLQSCVGGRGSRISWNLGLESHSSQPFGGREICRKKVFGFTQVQNIAIFSEISWYNLP